MNFNISSDTASAGFPCLTVIGFNGLSERETILRKVLDLNLEWEMAPQQSEHLSASTQSNLIQT